MTFANALENVIKISRQWDSTVFNNATHGFLYHSPCLLASPQQAIPPALGWITCQYSKARDHHLYCKLTVSDQNMYSLII